MVQWHCIITLNNSWWLFIIYKMTAPYQCINTMISILLSFDFTRLHERCQRSFGDSLTNQMGWRKSPSPLSVLIIHHMLVIHKEDGDPWLFKSQILWEEYGTVRVLLLRKYEVTALWIAIVHLLQEEICMTSQYTFMVYLY